MELLLSVLTFFSRFHVELWIYTSLFIFTCKRRNLFPLRYLLATVFFIALPYIRTPKGETIYYYSYLKIGEWVNFSWLIFYLLDRLLLFFLFKLSFKEVLFYGSSIYTRQHLLKRLILLFCKICSFSYSSLAYKLVCLFFLILLFFVYHFVFVQRIKEGEHINSNNIVRISISVITVFLYCFLSSYDDKYSQGNISLRISTTLTDILILTLLFGLFEQSKAKREKKERKRRLHEKQEDRILSKKNIDRINRKTHDLKHQIDALRERSPSKRSERLEKREEDISIYDNVAQTGNEVLNIVLTKKSLYCQKHGIQLNYNFDNCDISFIDDVDLYTIFGNIIDNATEALLKVKEKEKRIIFLDRKKKNGFFFLQEENYFSGPITRKDGYPQTSKNDTDYHGIGIKSIDYLVRKYNGNRQIDIKGQRFSLSLIIPFPMKEERKEKETE